MGKRLTTTRSINSILLSLAASRWLSRSRRAGNHRGYLDEESSTVRISETSPSSITCESTPALSRATLVPPVEIMSQPSFDSWANSAIPALSETLISAPFSRVFSFFSFLKKLLYLPLQSKMFFPINGSLFSCYSQTFQDFWMSLYSVLWMRVRKYQRGITGTWHTDCLWPYQCPHGIHQW